MHNTIIADPGSPYIPMYNFLPVYILCVLQVLDRSYFTSTTPNKDQRVDLLFCCLFVDDLELGYVRELRCSRLAACVLHAAEK